MLDLDMGRRRLRPDLTPYWVATAVTTLICLAALPFALRGSGLARDFAFVSALFAVIVVVTALRAGFAASTHGLKYVDPGRYHRWHWSEITDVYPADDEPDAEIVIRSRVRGRETRIPNSFRVDSQAVVRWLAEARSRSPSPPHGCGSAKF